jgi:hypothetical protein
VTNATGSMAVALTSIAADSAALVGNPGPAERRSTVDRFLVPVPTEPRVREPRPASPPTPSAPERESQDFELTAAAIRQRVIECMKRLHATLHVKSASGSEVSAQVSGGHGLDLVVSIDSPVSSGEFSARCDVYDVPFLLRGHLELSEPDAVGPAGEALAARHAVLSHLSLYVLDQRRGTRVELERGQAVLRWARVIDGMPRIVNSPIVDITPGGARIRLATSDPSPPTEPFVGELQLDGMRVPLLATVRHQLEAAGSGLAGLHLETGTGRRHLVELYMRGRLPGVVPRAEITREALTKLLGDSGYLKLRAGEGPSPGWHQYRSDQSVDVVYQARDGNALGHVSITRAYKNSWMMHQLATLSGHVETGACRRILYDVGACVPLAMGGEKALALAYFNRQRRWHQLFFEQFMQWLDDDAHGTLATFDRFERDPSAPAVTQAPPLEARYRIDSLKEDDLLLAVALIRSQLPPLLAETLNIHPEDLQSATLNGDPQRTRTAFVVRSNDALVGVALCETGPVNASLFNIFNMAQFYFCAGAQQPSVPAQLALLAQVRRFYADRGTERPLIVAPPGTLAANQEPGTTLAEEMGCVAIGGAGLRQWEHYCKLQMGQLYQRKGLQQHKEAQASYVS